MARTVTTLVPWFGSNRSLAENVGAALKGCAWVGVPFAGGMCELRHLDARTVVVSDLHRHVINLANVLRDPEQGPRLIRNLRRVPFHEDVLRFAQEQCAADPLPPSGPIWERLWSYAEALNYFVCAWMGRNGKAGTRGEFTGGLSVRWEAGGGDSATRWRSAVEALRDWRKVVARCTFVVMDVFDVLAKVKDEPEHGLYLDPPFPDAGALYKHNFTGEQQRRLAADLLDFKRCRVVARFYDHPLVRELYPEPLWSWNHFKGRKSTNEAGPEVLLTRNLPAAGTEAA
jgi:DNA adenine methylase